MPGSKTIYLIQTQVDFSYRSNRIVRTQLISKKTLYEENTIFNSQIYLRFTALGNSIGNSGPYMANAGSHSTARTQRNAN